MTKTDCRISVIPIKPQLATHHTTPRQARYNPPVNTGAGLALQHSVTGRLPSRETERERRRRGRGRELTSKTHRWESYGWREIRATSGGSVMSFIVTLNMVDIQNVIE